MCVSSVVSGTLAAFACIACPPTETSLVNQKHEQSHNIQPLLYISHMYRRWATVDGVTGPCNGFIGIKAEWRFYRPTWCKATLPMWHKAN